jgi:hypothetical protein
MSEEQRRVDAVNAVLAVADLLDARAEANNERARTTYFGPGTGSAVAYQALALGQIQAAHEIRAAITHALEEKP